MPEKSAAPDYVTYSDDVEPVSIQLRDDNDPVDGKFSLFEKPITDQLINTELSLPQGEEYRKARVVGRAKESKMGQGRSQDS